jgi:hypothetical protein
MCTLYAILCNQFIENKYCLNQVKNACALNEKTMGGTK